MAPEYDTIAPTPEVQSQGPAKTSARRLKLPPLIKVNANVAQQAFLVFAVLPAALGFALWKVEIPYAREGLSFGTIWLVWHPYQSGWCIVAAVLIWFVAIWRFLSKVPNPKWWPPEYFD